ncbi:MAG TPA: alpha/beta fold hydrolase [Dyella sp.]|nr:alpha/beta fold hydrolase [Dyella sp.]
MKTTAHLALLLATLLVAGLAPRAAAADTGPTCREQSAAILQSLRDGRYADATRNFDAKMAGALPASKLQEVWGSALPAQVGALQATDEPQVQSSEAGTLVETPLRFVKAKLVMRVGCDKAGKVSGLFFAPAPDSAAATPATDRPAGVSETALAVPSPLGPLPGTLTLPAGAGPFPAAVLVAGSGPNDRDETIGPNKPFRDLAFGLARQGIASLRYDKRTLVYGKQLAHAPLTVDDEVTDDALAAITLLRKQPKIDPARIFVIGHSLGALMAPRIAQRDGHLAGAVLLAAPERLDLDVVLRQLRYLQSLPGGEYASLSPEVAAVKAARETLAGADAAHPPAGSYFHAPASWWLSLAHYDAIDVARRLRAPLLVLQGEGDFQVPPAVDFAAWKHAFAASPRVTLRSYAGLSHLFMPAGEPPSPADYIRPAHVDPKVIGDMAAWIDKQPATKRP